MSSNRSVNISRGYIRLNLIYTTEAFFYLLAGLLVMTMSFLPSFSISRDAIYILWLFGFVGSMIFGITNIMIPSYRNRKEFSLLAVGSEIFFLNTGTIITFIGFNVPNVPVALTGLVMLIIATLIHLIDLSSKSGGAN